MSNLMIPAHSEKIDVLIPLIEKDLTVVPYVIDGIRNFVMHPIGDIYIAAPESASIKELCERKGYKFIFEDSILPLDKKDLYGGGWMLQQLIKLSCDTIGSNNHFLIADADTIMISPHPFMLKDKIIFYCDDLYWDCKSIFEHFRRLTRLNPVAHVSLINHYMFFSRTYLAELKRWIESIHGKPWYQAIVDTVDHNSSVPFSEYETYGNFMLNKFRDRVILARAKNLDLRFKDFKDFDHYDLDELAKHHKTISFHHRPED